MPDQGEDFLPNFRQGDMIYLYAHHEGQEPDVRASILYKGSMAEIRTDRLTVHLNDGQQNPNIFTPTDKRRPYLYAIEHGGSDIGTGSAIQVW